LVGGQGAEAESLFKTLDGKSLAGLAIGAGGGADLLIAMETEETAELKSHRAAGGIGSQYLEDESPESTANGKDAIATIGAVVGLGKELRWKDGGEELLQLGEGRLAERVDAPTKSGEACAQGGKDGSVHRKNGEIGAVGLPPY